VQPYCNLYFAEIPGLGGTQEAGEASGVRHFTELHRTEPNRTEPKMK
jgi:hypothetical protein